MSDGDSYTIPTDPDTPHPLGRSIVSHDILNRLHPFFTATTPAPPDRSSSWWSPDVFNQQGSSCTMQATIATLRSTPHRRRFTQWAAYDTETERHAAYLASQAHDPWTGGEPTYEGTSSDAPWRLLRERGHVTGWKWIFGPAELRRYVMHVGVCCVGTRWYTSMWRTGTDGYLRITPGATSAGGHEWRIVGYSLTRRAYRMCNSWGRGWGQSGRAWIDEATMARLLAEDGDCVTNA